jgi:F0F1-type ATP synthase assembly protein I
MQQIKIPNMNANEPAMTKSSAINAGIMVGIGVGICVVSLISTGFWFQFYGTGAYSLCEKKC